ncbi:MULTISPECIES: UDP-4-amino-4,6-dideoxy-N-acetyl-beta-L-altrosamine transaminase [unclassified Arsukibacterium]|uniref:UDP-4-amino-4, 6-dideoxy-N-acetyl-beta-L-altrosamine transaminase n=1 Tax=unclassified Arsukibacterium TaxID=2635278 RepID=UPI000C908FAA|nr:MULTISPECIES: UDP-4-amino-4,6-dideoxy-N-acetyl-beta-L-altrosamine transaminase [unclassified Arsukibacterium]MAA96311.1 UDP-4-amino-4,6-dideoxy-N-acetyl-beta-L-altrosamine transaminase [Rheinheimera sp.]HAW93130.1 UDP-4-amino-4,6-dideoxy-N-acetyl-beta-L-altrosamine transaminase [Candidatus Azambacteria bacterium]|tara:strand:+ start:396 stop:1574 length:1179 start_codon:yes stop_codon:yes gene_type:complete
MKPFKIPYGRQEIDEQDLAAVANVLKSDWLTQGPVVPEFEEAIAKRCNVNYSVAMSNATAALHLSCLALEVGPGDLVWTSPISFVASANCALYCGAEIDFVDVELVTGNLCTKALQEKLLEAKKKNKLPKVIIPVHFAGQSCDMARIAELAAEFNFKIIEDASHAIGGSYEGRAIGSCLYSDITIFSFHPVKIITSGEGGVATTNRPEVAKRLKMLRSHGITSDPDDLTEPSHGPWYYQQQILGFNYRLTDIHAALGLSQLSKLDRFVENRNALAKRYDKIFLTAKNIKPLTINDMCRSSYHLYVVRLLNVEIGIRKKCIEFLRSNGIAAHLHYIPIYLQPFYKKFGFKAGYCPIAELYYSQALTLPMYPSLTYSQQDEVSKKLELFLIANT